MSKWRYQRGELPMGCIVGLVLGLVVLMIVMKMTPIMLKMGDLEREVRILADRGNRIEYNDKRIKKEILSMAKQLDLPLPDSGVAVTRGNGRIVVEIKYDYPFEFPGYTYVKHVHQREDRPLF